MKFACLAQTWGPFHSGIDYLIKKGIGIDKFLIGIEVSYKILKSTK